MRAIIPVMISESLNEEGKAELVLTGPMEQITEKECVLLLSPTANLEALGTAAVCIKAVEAAPQGDIMPMAAPAMLDLFDHQGGTFRADSLRIKVQLEGLTPTKNLPIRVSRSEDPDRIKVLSRLPKSAYGA